PKHVLLLPFVLKKRAPLPIAVLLLPKPLRPMAEAPTTLLSLPGPSNQCNPRLTLSDRINAHFGSAGASAYTSSESVAPLRCERTQPDRPPWKRTSRSLNCHYRPHKGCRSGRRSCHGASLSQCWRIHPSLLQ